MTRHKQQLLQEQECLLEQIQRQNTSDDGENNNGEENGDKTSPATTDVEMNGKDDESSKPGKNCNDNGGARVFPSRLLAILNDQQKSTSKTTSSASTNNSTSSSGGSKSVEELSQSQQQELAEGIRLLDNSVMGLPINVSIIVCYLLLPYCTTVLSY